MLLAATSASTALHMQAPSMWTNEAVTNARARAAAVKADQDATVGAMAIGAGAVFALPLVDSVFADLVLSTIIGGGLLGFLAGFREDGVGDAARSVGGVVAKIAGQAAAKLDETGVVEKIQAKLPGGGGEGLSMSDIKKYGVAGTLAYVLTELAFWVVAFPVASTVFFNTAGHWPDFSDGSDRASVLAFIFAGTNVARLAVPMRFGVAFALAPWVDENFVRKLGIGVGGGDSKQ